jgi:hypothetical protein
MFEGTWTTPSKGLTPHPCCVFLPSLNSLLFSSNFNLCLWKLLGLVPVPSCDEDPLCGVTPAIEGSWFPFCSLLLGHRDIWWDQHTGSLRGRNLIFSIFPVGPTRFFQSPSDGIERHIIKDKHKTGTNRIFFSLSGPQKKDILISGACHPTNKWTKESAWSVISIIEMSQERSRR